MSVRIAKALSWICFYITFRVLSQIMLQPAFAALELEWRTFALDSSVVNVLPLSDFDLEKKLVFQTVAMGLIEWELL